MGTLTITIMSVIALLISTAFLHKKQYMMAIIFTIIYGSLIIISNVPIIVKVLCIIICILYSQNIGEIKQLNKAIERIKNIIQEKKTEKWHNNNRYKRLNSQFIDS